MNLELQKLLIRWKLWLPIVVVLLIHGILLLTDVPASMFQRESLTKEYETAMQFLSGPLTHEKQRFFEDEAKRRAADERFYENITNEMMITVSPEKLELLKKEYADYQRTAQISNEVWMVLSQEYEEVQADPEHRYFIIEKGWQRLLMHTEVDILLVFAILIFSGMSFAREYECGMATLLHTFRWGKRRLAIKKATAVLLVSAALTIFYEGLTLLVIWLRTPLLDAPLQSVSFLSNSVLPLSLWKVYGLRFVLKLLGAVYLAAVTMFVGVWARRSLPALFAGFSVVMIPVLLLQNTRFDSRLPLPDVLLRSNNFFIDTVTADPFHMNDILQIAAIALLITVLLLVLSVERYVRKGGIL